MGGEIGVDIWYLEEGEWVWVYLFWLDVEVWEFFEKCLVFVYVIVVDGVWVVGGLIMGELILDWGGWDRGGIWFREVKFGKEGLWWGVVGGVLRLCSWGVMS